MGCCFAAVAAVSDYVASWFYDFFLWFAALFAYEFWTSGFDGCFDECFGIDCEVGFWKGLGGDLPNASFVSSSDWVANRMSFDSLSTNYVSVLCVISFIIFAIISLMPFAGSLYICLSFVFPRFVLSFEIVFFAF